MPPCPSGTTRIWPALPLKPLAEAQPRIAASIGLSGPMNRTGIAPSDSVVSRSGCRTDMDGGLSGPNGPILTKD